MYPSFGTWSITSNHRVQGTFIKETRDQLNNTFSTAASMDTRSLEDRQTPQDLFTINYNAILSPTFYLEGRYSRRNFSFIGSGAPTLSPDAMLVAPPRRPVRDGVLERAMSLLFA